MTDSHNSRTYQYLAAFSASARPEPEQIHQLHVKRHKNHKKEAFIAKILTSLWVPA
jgi:hypothetical protein